MVDIIDFIEKAIQAERADREKYLRMADETDDPEARMVFEQLAKDEEHHERALKERLKAIKMLKG